MRKHTTYKTLIRTYVIILATLLAACGKSDVDIFFEGEYSLPKVMLKVQEGEASFERIHPQGPMYVVWFSREDCSQCAVNHLEEKFGYLWKLQQKTDAFDTMFIMSPNEDETDSIAELIKEYDFPWPVYLDVNNECPLGLPENPALHFFLMDKDGKPLWLGAPVHEGRIDDNFLNRINAL